MSGGPPYKPDNNNTIALRSEAASYSLQTPIKKLSRLSLWQIKSAHLGGAVRRELASAQYDQRPGRRVTLAHPCSATGVFELGCSNLHRIEAHGVGAVLQRRRHGQGSPRRIEPMRLSQLPFCHGDRAAVGRSRMPIARRRRMKTVDAVYRTRFFGHKFELSGLLHAGLLPDGAGLARTA